MSSTVVVIGAGFIGAQTAVALAKNKDLKVIVVDPKAYFENNIGAVRTQVHPELFDSVSEPHSTWAKNITVVQGAALAVKDHSVIVRKADGSEQEVKFDYGVLAMGTRYSAFKAQAPTAEDRKAALNARAKLIKEAQSILIVGGGPVGVESMGEILEAYPQKKVTLVHSHAEVIQNAPGAHDLFLKLIQKYPNAKFIGDDRVEVKVEASDALQSAERLELRSYHTQKGVKIDADFVIAASGIQPNSEALQVHLADTLTPKRYIKTDMTLQVTGHPSLFVVGDLAEVGMLRAAANYKDHASVVASNIAALAKNKPAKTSRGVKPLMAWPMVSSFGPSASVTVLPMFGGVKKTWKFFSNIKTGVMKKLPPNM